jgi:hypothetical protein
MPCNTLVEPACLAVSSVVKSAVGSATSDILSGVAQAITGGIRWIVANTATWWVQIPSPNLSTEPAVGHLQQWLLPITAAVATGGVIAAGVRMAITRRANPLLDLGGGLLTLAGATTLGATIAALLLKAGDAWSSWVLQASTGGHFTQRLDQLLDLGGNAAPAVVLIFGVIAIIFALVQAVLMLFRQAALVVLAGALPLAAAGSIAPVTRTWVRKVTAWMLALIFYKPAAAAVYAAAFTMIGSGGSPRTALMGFAMLALSVVMLPALMKFFTWTTGSIAGGGGGGQFLGTAAMGAVAVGAMRSSPGGAASAAQDQASYLSSRLGPPPPEGSGSASPPGGSPAGPGAGGSGGYSPRTPTPPSGRTPASGFFTGTRWAPTSAVPSGAASASPSPSGAAAGPAQFTGAAAVATDTGGAAAAGPAAAASGAGAQAASRGTRLATGAMEPGDSE